MGISKIEICNVALAMFGADSIRSFDENNKRARMADVFFDFTRDYLLTKFDWPFAKRLVTLSAVAESEPGEVPDRMYRYLLPEDCHAPRDLHPAGSRDRWEVMDKFLFCETPPGPDTEVKLFYTAKVVDTKQYTSTFNNLLALGLAVKLCPVITQDKALTATLLDQFNIEQLNAWEADANMTNDYRAYDEDPNNDSFVNPDGVTPIDDTWR